MNKVWLQAALLGVGALVAAAASAAELPKRGVYVGGSLGSAEFEIEQNRYDDILLRQGAGGLRSSVEESDLGYKLRIGYRFNEFIALEGEYADLGEFEYRARYTSPVVASDKLKFSASGVGVAVVGSLPMTPAFSLFGKVGLFHSKLEVDENLSGDNVYEGSEQSTNVWAGVGGEYSPLPNFSLRLEYERFSNVGGDDALGEKDVDLFSLGANVHF